jgi:hypothetical protein
MVMSSDRDNKKGASEVPDNERYVDKGTREVIWKHLTDPNHKITEQDIANVDTEMYNRPLPEDDEVKKEVDDLPNKAPSAWDVNSGT